MASRVLSMLVLAAVVALSAPAAFSFWAPRPASASPAALRGSPSGNARFQAASVQEESSSTFSGAAAFAVAAAFGLVVALTGTPALADEAAEAPKEAQKDKMVLTTITKEERLAKQKARMQAENDRLQLTKDDGTLKNGQ
eukprot:CAMPEP_0113820810 /NCGR_PEP_ID=MMETSP0328-20130328/1425_1 /TAXON_ID=39455 /ORGANISM="Alexandrium minutum" /LENGTH=139 /DNA_ID=CAMNT_0000788743 /DNA_START=105 /DNA_END=524 /DNA_ORIENTATION=+ /assembly_acc=CAM_ASM_000350